MKSRSVLTSLGLTLAILASLLVWANPASAASPFTKVASAYSHSCALDSSGDAYCWGYNANGRLGDGTQTNRPAPTKVSTALKFTDITLGR